MFTRPYSTTFTAFPSGSLRFTSLDVATCFCGDVLLCFSGDVLGKREALW